MTYYYRDLPLTEDDIARVAPSVMAAGAHDSRSARYVYVPTIEIVRGLLSEGFQVHSAQEAQCRTPDRQGYTKHLLRLRREGHLMHNGAAPEVILINSHDGSCRYRLMAGMFRFACANGLIVGDGYADVRVRHTGEALDEVIEGAYQVVSTHDRVAAAVETMSCVPLSQHEQQAFAKAALQLRFDGREAPISAERLLERRRAEDTASDLWTTFNVIQENVLAGRQRYISRTARGRRRNQVRPVKGIDQSTALNRALWTLAEAMAELKDHPVAD